MNIEILPWDVIQNSIECKSYIRIPSWDVWIETTGNQKFIHEQLVAMWSGLPTMVPEFEV